MNELCLCGHPADSCLHAPFVGRPYKPVPITEPVERTYPPCPVLAALKGAA